MDASTLHPRDPTLAGVGRIERREDRSAAEIAAEAHGRDAFINGVPCRPDSYTTTLHLQEAWVHGWRCERELTPQSRGKTSLFSPASAAVPPAPRIAQPVDHRTYRLLLEIQDISDATNPRLVSTITIPHRFLRVNEIAPVLGGALDYFGRHGHYPGYAAAFYTWHRKALPSIEARMPPVLHGFRLGQHVRAKGWDGVWAIDLIMAEEVGRLREHPFCLRSLDRLSAVGEVTPYGTVISAHPMPQPVNIWVSADLMSPAEQR